MRCANCGLEQPSSPADYAPVTNLTLLGEVPRDCPQLNDFARRVGAPTEACELRLVADGVPVRVWLDINSGSVVGLELGAASPGMVPMRLTREAEADRRAKEAGLAREVQLGDLDFDARVYIDSPATDDQVRLALEPRAVRRAVLALLARRDRIEFTPIGVILDSDRDRPSCFDPDVILAQLAALRALAGAPRPLAVALVAPAPGASFTWLAALLSALVGVPVAGATLATMLPVDPLPVLLTAAVLGWGSWFLLAGRMRAAVAGRSSFRLDAARVRAATFVGFPCLALAALLLINGVGSATVRLGGRVTSTSTDSEDKSLTHVGVTLENGLVVGYTTHAGAPSAGRPAAATVHRGSLGIWWGAKVTLLDAAEAPKR